MNNKVSPGVWVLMAAVFVLTAGASYFVWHFLNSNETRRAEKMLSSASENLQDRVQAELDTEATAVQRLASKWQKRPVMDRTEWEGEVKQVLEDFPSLLSIAWLENPHATDAALTVETGASDWTVTWSQPSIYEPAVKKLHGLVQKDRGALLTELVTQRQMRITDAIHVADRGKAFAAYAPSVVDGKLKGAVMGVFHLQILMDTIFDKILAGDYSLQLLDGSQIIYNRGLPKAKADDWEHTGNMKVFGASWKMRLWPNPEVQAGNEKLARQILYSGIALGALLSIFVYFAGRRETVPAPVAIPGLGLRAENSEVRRKTEERLRIWEAAIANVDDAIFVAETEKIMGGGTPILFVNEAFSRLTGYAPADVAGKTPKMLYQEEGAQQAVAAIDAAMAKWQGLKIQLPITRKEAAPLAVELRLKPVLDSLNKTTHWIFLLKPVPVEVENEVATSAPLTEMAPALKTATLLEALLAETPMALQVVSSAGAVLGWNHLAQSMTGWPAEELLGKLSPIPVDTTAGAAWQRREIHSARKSGERLDLQVWAAPLHDPENPKAPAARWMCLMADVTEDRIAQEEFAARESRFRRLVENAADILAVLDVDATIEYINPAVRSALGFTPESLTGTQATNLIESSDVPAMQKSMEEARLGEGASRPRTLHVRHEDGSLRQMESVIRMIEGTHLAVLSARDVTGRSRPEMPEVSPAWFLNSVQDAIITFDPESRVIWMNRAAEDLYDLSAAFAQGKTISELLPDWLQVPSRESIREALDTKGFWKGEVSNYTPSGREIVQDVSVTATYDAEKRRIGAVAIHRDITEKKSAIDAIAIDEKTRTLNSLGNSDGLWDWNLRTDEVYFSPRWKEMLGYADEDITGDSGEWYLMVHPDDITLLRNKLANHLKGHTEHLEVEYRIRTKPGEYRWMMSRAMAMRNASGEATRLVGLQIDIHEQKDMEEQLLFEAFHDSVTGLANRALFLDRVNGLLAQKDAAFSVAFMDLERFATVNEALGTKGGDRALAEAGRRITESLPKDSFVARHGSDEFVALVRTTDAAKLRDLAELLRYQLAKPFDYQGKQTSLKLQLGFASTQGNVYTSGEDMLQHSSRAMAASRGGVAAAAPTLEPTASDSLPDDMRRAIAAGEFRVFYHPIIHLDSGEIGGVEALLRWQHPERGLLTPKDFLPAAESTGLILDLDRWMIGEACLKARELNERFRRTEPLVLTVNLSSLHFAKEDFTSQLSEILENSHFNPRYLRIELSEQVVMHHPDSDEMLRNLGRLRVQLNIDHYSESADALQNLSRLPIDRVKLDAVLIRGLNLTRNLEKVRAIIGMAKSQNLQVVAEGVETLEQLAVLRELKCHLAQGFYFTQPASATDTERLLARSPRW